MPRQPAKDQTYSTPKRLARGFVQTGGILNQSIRRASEKRGFSETRLLTQWAEIVGPALAGMSQPVKVAYGRESFGATLTVLTNGANAPMVQMEIPRIKDRVNACYGYAAISHIRITQTAATGFAETQTPYRHDATPAKVNPVKAAEIDQSVETVESDLLRSALAVLGRNILSRTKLDPT